MCQTDEGPPWPCGLCQHGVYTVTSMRECSCAYLSAAVSVAQFATGNSLSTVCFIDKITTHIVNFVKLKRPLVQSCENMMSLN